MTSKLGLALNEEKTSLCNARVESFDFLGYTFGPHYFRKTGHWYLGVSPSRKSVQRFKGKVTELRFAVGHGDLWRVWLEDAANL